MPLPPLSAFAVHGATAIAQTIFGENNPGGKLPVTLYPSGYVNEVDFLDMSMEAGPGRSYRYYHGTPLFPFGHGLSYTTFDLKWSPKPPPTGDQQQRTVLVAPAAGARATAQMYNVNVTNTGSVAGDEVVLAFVKPLHSTLRTLPHGTPIERRRLFGWRRVNLAPGGSVTLSFSVGADELAMIERDGHKAVHPGHFDIILSRGHGRELTTGVALRTPGGAPQRLRSFRRWW
jgi:beta-D-xylosidase 4